MQNLTTASARFADKPEDFAKLGIQPGRIQVFEDGMRTQGGPGGRYEWWFFDSHLSDGSPRTTSLAKLARFDGAYLRFTGNVQLEPFVNGELVEDVSDPGIWEMMYFGHPYR